MQQSGDSTGASWEHCGAVGVIEQSAEAAYRWEKPMEATKRIGWVQREREKAQNTHSLHFGTRWREYTQTHVHKHQDMKVLQENKTCSVPHATGLSMTPFSGLVQACG